MYMETAERAYGDTIEAVNRPERASVREEIRSLQEQQRRLEESLADAHKRLQLHDQRITSVERGIGE